MDALERNHNSMLVATGLMLLVTAALITFGLVLFPISAYSNPSAGLIPGLINTPKGNILVIAMFGVLATNVAVFLNNVTRLERERNTLLAHTAAGANQEHSEVIQGIKASGALNAPQETPTQK